MLEEEKKKLSWVLSTQIALDALVGSLVGAPLKLSIKLSRQLKPLSAERKNFIERVGVMRKELLPKTVKEDHSDAYFESHPKIKAKLEKAVEDAQEEEIDIKLLSNKIKLSEFGDVVPDSKLVYQLLDFFEEEEE